MMLLSIVDHFECRNLSVVVCSEVLRSAIWPFLGLESLLLAHFSEYDIIYSP
jgi:hypothetical protein